jgi:hypothetical protein
MIATYCLIGCMLAPGQLPDRSPAPPPSAPAQARGEWQLGPRLGHALELVYRGTFREEAFSSRVQFNRAYRAETRVFVLETSVRGAQVAFFTMLKARDPRAASNAPAVNSGPVSSAVRLEIAQIDPQGKIQAEPGVSLAVPLEGVPTVDCSAFLEVPAGRVAVGDTWETGTEGRPLTVWRVAGVEMVNGTSCVKLAGVQQSDDWNRPRADRSSWRRQDTVWLSPRLGIAYRVERLIEEREPARQEPTMKSFFRADLESSLQYPGPLFESRLQEINQARAFQEAAAPLLANPTRYSAPLTALLGKINQYLEQQPPTPYREAVLQARRRVEAGLRGETPATGLELTSLQVPVSVAGLGQHAPDFVVSDFNHPEGARLRTWLGRPILMVFFNPTSSTADRVLRYAQQLQTMYGTDLNVLALSVTDEPGPVQHLRDSLKLTLPLLKGSGLRISYAVETTPKLMIIDATGVVRGSYLGWGHETSREVFEELKRWLPGR